MAGEESTASGRLPSFSTRLAFIIVTAGSAVGLGNIWGFTYVAGKNGGGGFVLIYLLALAFVAAPVFIAELLLGRMGKGSPPTALGNLQQQTGSRVPWPIVAWAGLVGTILVLSFYCVIAGQAIYYALVAAGGGFADWSFEQVAALDADFKANAPGMALWAAVFMGLTAAIVSLDIRAGIERAGKIMMPLLFLMLMGLVAYGAVYGDFMRAVTFLFGFHQMDLSVRVLLEAVGQAFFTLGIGVGGIMMYGAYSGRDVKVGSATAWIVAMDLFVALAAGLAIFPLVFASGVDAAAGPGLVFLTLPQVFTAIPGGAFVAFVFFLLLVFAAITSSISLLSPTVARLEEAGWRRPVAAGAMASLAFLVGLLTVMSFSDWSDIHPLAFLGLEGLTAFDLIREGVSNFVLPLSGLAYVLMIGWALRKDAVQKSLSMQDGTLFQFWHMAIRFIVPVAIIAMFLTALFG